VGSAAVLHRDTGLLGAFGLQAVSEILLILL